MGLKSIIAALTGLFAAGALAAQTPPAASLTPPAPVPENMLNLDLSTGGRVIIQLRPDIAPATVERIKTLTQQGFYNGLTFHRVIDGFMAQGGDPKGDGTGGSTLPDLKAEFNSMPHVRGAIAMARPADVNGANSQFFIMLAPRLSLDNNYTVFGRVVSGMAHVDAVEKGEPPLNPSRIVRASIGADAGPAPVAAPAMPAGMSASEAPQAAEQAIPTPQ